ncbi:Expressed conserved protein [Schistosoma japonicum]|nr:Expressed conserved protein [Schistosoma japonicum]
MNFLSLVVVFCKIHSSFAIITLRNRYFLLSIIVLNILLLLNLSDYVGFLKKVLKLMHGSRYLRLRRVDLDIIPLDKLEQESLVPDTIYKVVLFIINASTVQLIIIFSVFCASGLKLLIFNFELPYIFLFRLLSTITVCTCLLTCVNKY